MKHSRAQNVVLVSTTTSNAPHKVVTIASQILAVVWCYEVLSGGEVSTIGDPEDNQWEATQKQ